MANKYGINFAEVLSASNQSEAIRQRQRQNALQSQEDKRRRAEDVKFREQKQAELREHRKATLEAKGKSKGEGAGSPADTWLATHLNQNAANQNGNANDPKPAAPSGAGSETPSQASQNGSAIKPAPGIDDYLPTSEYHTPQDKANPYTKALLKSYGKSAADLVDEGRKQLGELQSFITSLFPYIDEANDPNNYKPHPKTTDGVQDYVELTDDLNNTGDFNSGLNIPTSDPTTSDIGADADLNNAGSPVVDDGGSLFPFIDATKNPSNYKPPQEIADGVDTSTSAYLPISDYSNDNDIFNKDLPTVPVWQASKFTALGLGMGIKQFVERRLSDDPIATHEQQAQEFAEVMEGIQNIPDADPEKIQLLFEAANSTGASLPHLATGIAVSLLTKVQLLGTAAFSASIYNDVAGSSRAALMSHAKNTLGADVWNELGDDEKEQLIQAIDTIATAEGVFEAGTEALPFEFIGRVVLKPLLKVLSKNPLSAFDKVRGWAAAPAGVGVQVGQETLLDQTNNNMYMRMYDIIGELMQKDTDVKSAMLEVTETTDKSIMQSVDDVAAVSATSALMQIVFLGGAGLLGSASLRARDRLALKKEQEKPPEHIDEPVVDEQVEPTDDQTEPAEEPTDEPADDQTEPADEPTDEQTEPADDQTEPVDETTEPDDEQAPPDETTPDEPIEPSDDVDVEEATAEDLTEEFVYASDDETYQSNIDALRTLKERKTGYPLSDEQRDTVRGYKGFSTIPETLDEGSPTHTQLGEFLSESEISAIRDGLDNSAQTPDVLVEGVHAALRKLGAKDGARILDVGAGTGNFVRDDYSFTAVENDPVASKILKAVHGGRHEVIGSGIESVTPIENGFVSVIGAPPSSNDISITDGETTEVLSATRAVLRQSGKSLVDGGVAVIVLPKNVVDELGAERSIEGFNVVDAVRLKGGTVSDTDVVVLQKGEPTDASDKAYFEEHADKVVDSIEGLQQFVDNLPEGLIDGLEGINPDVVDSGVSPDGAVNGAFSISGDNVVFTDVDTNGNSITFIVPNDGSALFSDYVGLRDVYIELLDAETGIIDGDIEGLRKELNKRYDAFVKAHGTLNKPLGHKGAYKNTSELGIDKYFNNVQALEADGKKADIFSKRILYPPNRIGATDNIDTAAVSSIDEHGGVDLEHMASLMGITPHELVSRYDGSKLFYDSRDGVWKPDFVFLSGNLADLRLVPEHFDKYFKQITDAMPPEKGIDEIDVLPNSPSVPLDVVNSVFDNFGFSVSKNAEGKRSAKVKLRAKALRFEDIYGGDGWTFKDVVAQSLLPVPTKSIKRTVDGGSVVDYELTSEFKAAVNRFNEAFAEIIRNHSRLSDEVSIWYNARYNSYVPMVTPSVRMPVGLSSTFSPRVNQEDGLSFATFHNSALLNHATGSGKSFTLAATALKHKEMGAVRNGVMATKASLIPQLRREIIAAFPRMSVWTPTPKEVSNPERFAAMLNNNNYDIVIVSHNTLQRLPLPEQGVEGAAHFDALGIDGLYIDEAHVFKNVPYQSAISSSVKGFSNPAGNNATRDLLLKANHLNNTGGRLVLATATPVSNSMAELNGIFQMMGMGMPMDDFLSLYADINSQVEAKITGGFAVTARLREFKNMDTLQKSLLGFMHTVTTNDLVRLNTNRSNSVRLPKMRTGAPQIVEVEPTTRQLELTEEYKALARENDPRLRLSLYTKLRDLAVTPLVADQSDTLLRDTGGKIDVATDNIARIYHEGASDKSTQLVFLDVDKFGDNGSLHSLVKDWLVEKGVNSDDIVLYSHLSSKEAQITAQLKMKRGDARIFIGTLDKMGEGLNVQNRLVASHTLNPAYTPKALTQSIGRIIRSGNELFEEASSKGENFEVDVMYYVTKNSMEGLLWDLITNKDKMIQAFFAGADISSMSDNIDQFMLSHLSTLATASSLDAQDLMLKMDVEQRIRTLKAEVSAADRAVAKSKVESVKLETEIENLTARIDAVALEPKVEKVRGNQFKVTLGNKAFSGKNTYSNAQKALGSKIILLERNNTEVLLGEYEGIAFYAHKNTNGVTTLKIGKSAQYSVYIPVGAEGTALPEVRKVAETMHTAITEELENALASAQQSLAQYSVVRAGEHLSRKRAELEDAVKELAAIDARLINSSNELGNTDHSRNLALSSNHAVYSRAIPIVEDRVEPVLDGVVLYEQGQDNLRPEAVLEEVKKVTGRPIFRGGKGFTRGVSGLYTLKTKSISARFSNVETVIHELAHALEFGIDVFHSFVKKNKGRLFRYDYKVGRQDLDVAASEGFAEFVRAWATNRAFLEESAPELLKEFDALIANLPDKKLAKSIKNVQLMGHKYFAQPKHVRDQLETMIVNQHDDVATTHNVKQSVMEGYVRGVNMFGRVPLDMQAQAWVNLRQEPFLRSLNDEIFDDRTEFYYAGKVVPIRPFSEVVKPYRQSKELHAEFQHLRIMLRYSDLDISHSDLPENIRAITKGDVNSYIQKTVSRLIDTYGGEFVGKMVEDAKALTELWANAIAAARKTGMVSAEYGNNTNFYIPFNRMFAEYERRGNSNPLARIRAKSTRPIHADFEIEAEVLSEFLHRTAKFKFFRDYLRKIIASGSVNIVSDSQLSPDAMDDNTFDKVAQLPPDIRDSIGISPDNSLIEHLAENGNIFEENGKAYVTVYSRTLMGDAMRKTTYEIRDAGFISAVKAFNHHIPMHWTLSMASLLAKMLSIGVVFDPVFTAHDAARNASTSALVYGKWGALKATSKVPQAVFEIIKSAFGDNTTAYSTIRKRNASFHGVSMAALFGVPFRGSKRQKDIVDIRRIIDPSLKTKVLTSVETLLSIPGSAVIYAILLQARTDFTKKAGRAPTVDELATLVHSIHPVTEHGSSATMNALRRTTPFLSTSLQMTHGEIRSVLLSPHKDWHSKMSFVAPLIVSYFMLGYIFAPDGEDERSDYQKSRFVLVDLGDVDVKIPIPHGTTGMSFTSGATLRTLAEGKNETYFTEALFTTILFQVLPQIKAVYDLAAHDKNAMDRLVVNIYTPNAPASESGLFQSSQIAERLSAEVDIPPSKIDAYVNTLFGTLGRRFLAFMDANFWDESVFGAKPAHLTLRDNFLQSVLHKENDIVGLAQRASEKLNIHAEKYHLINTLISKGKTKNPYTDTNISPADVAGAVMYADRRLSDDSANPLRQPIPSEYPSLNTLYKLVKANREQYVQVMRNTEQNENGYVLNGEQKTEIMTNLDTQLLSIYRAINARVLDLEKHLNIGE